MNSKIITNKHQALKLVLTLVLACSFILFIGGVSSFGRIRAANVTITSAAQFAEYSQNYSAENQFDVITIAIASGSEIVNEDFVSLGTEDYPFAGEINVPTGGYNAFRLYNCPLFNYVSTQMTVTGLGIINIERIKSEETSGTGGALFANHVVGHVVGTGSAEWSISLADYTLNVENVSNASSFAGLIGDIAASADVTVNFTNTSSLNVSGSGNIGYICGTLGDGATLNVTTAGSHSNISVTSTGGHAGGLVGKMGTGAKLKFNSDNYTHVTSVTTNANEKYAGGIVGYVTEVNNADNFSFKAGVTDYAVSGTVTGKAGAGGLFGYYKNSIASETFTLAGTYSITSGMNISSTGSTGGVFGVLENNGASFTFDGNASGSETFNVNLSGGSNRGGVCGTYKTNALINTFEITDTSPTIRGTSGGDSGGLIGRVSDNPAYIVIPTTTVTVQSGSLGGGLIGTIGGGGIFVDVSGTTTIIGSCDAGLIRTMTEGVLRIQGTTDLSGFNAKDGATSGQIVRSRERALIYALGDGEGTNGNWTLKRNLSNAIDDVYSWGQVLRVDGTILIENDLFNVDTTAHTVTVKVPVNAMGTVTDFAKTALNIQLGTAAGKGALQFDSPNQASTLLCGTLSLTGDISLAGTGITGITRDNGTNPEFSGTFNGNNHTITFATGEKYGVKENGDPLAADSKQGNIYNHEYNGLFAKTNGASFINLKLSGKFTINQKAAMKLGGLTANATGTLTINNVATNNFSLDFRTSSDLRLDFGGAVGNASGGFNITVVNSNFKPIVSDASTITGNNNPSYMGGVIGCVSAANSQHVSFTSSTIGMTYTKSKTNARRSCFGSAIARIENKGYAQGDRTVLLDNVTIDITADGAVDGNKFSGILGAEWLSVDVTIGGNNGRVTVSNATLTAHSSADFGGLVHTATGYWNVKSITLTADKVKFKYPTSSTSTFGFIANKTWTSENGADTALYLDVVDANYNISALKFVDSGGTEVTSGLFNANSYDEIVANSCFNTNDITNNGNSVISITTSGDVINTSGSTYNTYLNKTAYGKTAGGKINPNTRYYYNLAYARGAQDNSDIESEDKPKYNFLTWTVGQYAHSSLAGWFTASNTFTGDLDMTGLSYYPIDLTTGVTFSNATLKLDNNLMEDYVKYAYSGETGTRSTRSATNPNQHYLMHTAAFRNVTSGISISGLTIQGNVPKLSDSFCGFLVAGTFGGNETGDPTVFSASNVTFDGAFVSNAGDNFTDTTYAPLFINKIGKRTAVTINGAMQSAYSSFAGNSQYAGSSLIGDVGDASARTITLTFSDLRFDGRSIASSIGNMNTTYGTTKSIFSRATILNSFMYAGECTGTYNYEIDKDWTNSTTAIHHVTYGQEITTSVENSNKQKKYHGSSFYTHPTEFESSIEYDFSEGYLPYVYEAYNLSQSKHELSVNVAYNSDITGVGKYDDPYIIDDGDKLVIISKILYHAEDLTSAVKINLPSDISNYNYTSTEYEIGNYAFGMNDFSKNSGSGNSTVSNATVRQYLAGAYYLIEGDLLLDNSFIGLGLSASGVSASDHPKYAFRGVLIGKDKNNGEGDPEYPTITNNSRYPLIYTSMGSVIKDLTVVVDIDEEYFESNSIPLAAPTGSATYEYSGGIQTYGAVIGQVFGGDTIIDNVQVTFTDVEFSITGNENTTFTRLVPIGGYVGTLVNGGLIFRNMTASNKGLTNSVCDKIDKAGYLYVNPIIGRVIAGYAFHETSAYAVTSASIPNGTKNYTICDLVKPTDDAGKLDVTSSYVVNVPNGQAMYVLGAIVNSGAASAGSATDNYNALSGFWSAYYNHTTVRGGSDYSTVGALTDAVNDNEYKAACNDAYANTTPNKIPYIIRAYTKANSNNYYARSLSNKNGSSINITGDCNVAAGFRGIGSIYLDDDLVRLRISKMYGTKTNGVCPKITLHMNYKEYEPSHENYKADKTNYLNTNFDSGNIKGSYYVSKNAGFGLLNRLIFTGNDYIKDFYLAGSVDYDVIGISSGTSIEYSWNDSGVKAYNILNVGGLAGIAVDTTLNIQNVNFAGLELKGPKYVGGLIGCVSIVTSNVATIEKCGSKSDYNDTSLTITAGKVAGGLFGYVQVGGNNATGNNGRMIIQGDSEKTTLKSVNLTVSGPIDVNDERLMPSVGGLIGYSDSPWGTSGNYGLKIEKMIVEGGSLSVSNKNSNDLFGVAGGFIGGTRGERVNIKDSDIKKLNFYADVVGGVVGFSHIYKVSVSDYENITIDGYISDESNAKMEAVRSVGGVHGLIEYKDNPQITVNYDKIKVLNYNLESTSESKSNTSVGGLIGDVRFSNKQNIVKTINCRNIVVNGCVLSAKYSNGNGHRGVGGLFGTTEGNGYQKAFFYGYNILINVELNGTATNNYGAIVGNNITDGIVKIVGISTSISTEKTLGTGEYKNNGYVIYADYNAVQTNTAFAGIGSPTDVTSASPYVTANPSITIGGSTLITITGDGVATDVASLPINRIITDGTTGRYKYSAAAYYTGSTGDTNIAAFNSDKLAMFKSEVTEFTGTDFPVLILDTTEKENSHKLINSYLRLLTNTTFDFGADNAAFDVEIYNMKYVNGGFVAYSRTGGKATAPSLKLSSDGKFYMLNNAIDSGKVQFSLIDVRFYDPADSTKVAYHLYVPVFVKKVLSYQFEIVIKTGTTYLESAYLPFSGEHELIENVGMPVTAYFKYTYSRTASDWENAINAGENISRNYAKSLVFTKANETIPVAFPSGTILVLVDKQTGKPYYSTWGEAFSEVDDKTGTLDLSAFKSVMTKNGNSVTFSGESFEPMKFEQMMTLSVSDAGGTLIKDTTMTVKNGKAYRVATSAELANGNIQKYTIDGDTVTENNAGDYVNCDSEIVVIIDSDAYRYAEEGEEGTKYTVDVTAIQGSEDENKKIEESYYLSIFTEMTDGYDLFHYYNVTAPAKFEDDNNPAKIENTGDDTKFNLIMGKIFDHGEFEISSLSVENENAHDVQLITDTNNVLQVTISAQMGLASSLGELNSEMATKMGYTPVYQSFLVYLTRKDGNETIKAILGSPTVEGKFGIDTDLTDDVKAGEITGYSDIDVTQNYAEFKTGDLSSQFATGNIFGVNATLTFTYGASGIPSQFPGRGTLPENRDNGVAVSGSSNIGFSQTTTAYSKNSVGTDETPAKWYYSSVKPEVATLDLIPINGAGMFDFTALGINARNLGASNINTEISDGKTYAVSAEFRLLAEINAEPIWAQISDYTSAVIEITLAQKQSDGTYGGDLDISNYITGIKVGSEDATNSETTVFAAEIARSSLSDDGTSSSKIRLPWLHFTVKTGKPFEEANLTYGNFRVTVSVHLKKGSGDLAVSNVTNYVIYTNAKVIPEFIIVD